jgi:hypothetical protein
MIVEVKDNECLYCQDNLLIIGELFCCNECYNDFHEENEDYYWCEKENIYKLKENDFNEEINEYTRTDTGDFGFLPTNVL